MTSRGKALAWQTVAVITATAVVLYFANNVVTNLAARGMQFGFGFLWAKAGFDIPFHLVEWDVNFPYGRALWVAGVNTLFAAAICIILSSALGLTLALMRLSGNPLAVGTARALIEVIRNTPQLLQIVFFYFAVLQSLPAMRQSVTIGTSVFLNVRGLYVPAASGTGWDWIAGGTIIAVALAALLWRRQDQQAGQ